MRGRRQPDWPPRCSASTATRCASKLVDHKLLISPKRLLSSFQSCSNDRSLHENPQALISVSDKTRRRRLRPRLSPTASSCSPPAAPPSCCARPACRSPKSPTTPASRKCSTAASRPCTRRCMAASSASARTCRARGDHAEARHPADRPGGREPLPVRADRGEEGLHAGRRHREHRHRRPDHGARGGQEPRQSAAASASSPTRRITACHRRDELQANGGALSYRPASALAKKAFTHTARYDAAIANWLTSLDDADQAGRSSPIACSWPSTRSRPCATARTRTSRRRSTASRRRWPASSPTTEQLQGKELSYNNIADADAAWECVKAFDTPACVIVKHANPCGVAVAPTRWRPTRKPSRPTRPRPSAASSPSTARSTPMSSRP
jgi:hypothetical protein